MSTQKFIRKSLPPLAYLKNGIIKQNMNRNHQGAIFCTGFMSHMRATKATRMEDYFTAKNMDFIRFDYTDVGESVDKNIPAKYSFKQWHLDVLNVLDHLTQGPQIVIGSSMGGWLALLAAIMRPERVAGLVLIAPGIDFFPRFRYLVPDDKLSEFENGKIIMIDGPFGHIPLNKNFTTESEPFHLLDKPNIPVNCPVRILHATGDPYTSFQVSVDLISKLTSPNIQVHLVKSDDHRMSSDEDLKLLYQQIDNLIEVINLQRERLKSKG